MKKKITSAMNITTVKNQLMQRIQNGDTWYSIHRYLAGLYKDRKITEQRYKELHMWFDSAYMEYINTPKSEDIGESFDTISEFLGKDIWVKCRIKDYREDGAYIKFHTVYDDGAIDCSILTEEAIRKIPESHEWYRNKLMTSDDYLNVGDIKIIKPLVTLTSKEIDPDYIDDVTELLSYVGTNYWVKVTFSESYFDFEDYIKIVNVEGIFIDYQSIRADVLKGEIYEKYDWESAIEDIDEVETVNISKVRICKPLDVLTDEEMQEEIDRIGAEVAEWGDEW